MQSPDQQRIEKAWEHARGWITDFSGAPMVSLLVNVPALNLLPGLKSVAAEAESLRITAIPADRPAEPAFVGLETLADQIDALFSGRLAQLSANWAVRSELFELDIHLIVHPVEARTAALELDWWSDQVFSAETDDPAQFAALLGYFIGLQKRFGSPQLFLSSESGLDPAVADDAWVEV